MSDCIVTAETYNQAKEALPVLRDRLEEFEKIDKHSFVSCQIRRAIAQCEAVIEVYEANK